MVHLATFLIVEIYLINPLSLCTIISLYHDLYQIAYRTYSIKRIQVVCNLLFESTLFRTSVPSQNVVDAITVLYYTLIAFLFLLFIRHNSRD